MKKLQTENQNFSGTTVILDESRASGADVGEGSNAPDKTLDPSVLGIDEFLVDKLTQKPPEKYKFRRSIACGGMKVVLEVRDMDTMRNVAMAVMPDAQTRPPADILRFIQEARLTASLEHPNIVPVHDIGMDANGSPYFTMKLLRGRTLAALLTKLETSDEEFRKSFPLYRLLRVFLKICSGVDFAHSRGVIHLDLKPENIQLGDFGEVLIMDWGLAKTIKSGDDIIDGLTGDPEKKRSDSGFRPIVTMDGLLKGTPGYMAPEQARGLNSRKDKRTDVYALGAILYALVTHKDPIEKKSVQEMVADTVRGAIIPPRLRAPEKEIPAAIEAVVLKAMSVRPEDRYASVAELREEVNNYLNGYATRAEQASVFRKSLLLILRNKIFAAAAAIILLILGSGVFFAFQEQRRRAEAWLPVCPGSLSALFSEGHQIRFLDRGGGETEKWSVAGGKLAMVPGEWMTLNDPLNHDWRLEILFSSPRAEDVLEIRLDNGLLFRIGANSGVRDQICKINPATGEVLRELTGNISAVPDSYGIRRAVLQREGGKITFRTGDDAREYSCSVDFLPPMPEGNTRFSFHTESEGVLLRNLRLSTRRTAERTTPLIAADALFEVCLYEAALKKYLNIADSYGGQAFCDLALLKAYQIAILYGAHLPGRREKIAEVKKRIAARKNYLYTDLIRETDAAGLWLQRECIPALMIVSSILEKNPKSDILLRLLTVSRNRLSPEAASVLCDLLGRSKWLTSLDVSGLGLTSLEGLRGLKLHYLDCSGNDLESLEPIRDMPLRLLVTDRGIFQGPLEIAEAISTYVSAEMQEEEPAEPDMYLPH